MRKPFQFWAAVLLFWAGSSALPAVTYTLIDAQMSYTADDSASVWVNGTARTATSAYTVVTENIYSDLGTAGGYVVFEVQDSKKDISALWANLTVQYSDSSFCNFDLANASAVQVWVDPDGMTGGLNDPGSGGASVVGGDWRNGFLTSNTTLYSGPTAANAAMPSGGVFTLAGDSSGLAGSTNAQWVSGFSDAASEPCNCAYMWISVPIGSAGGNCPLDPFSPTPVFTNTSTPTPINTMDLSSPTFTLTHTATSVITATPTNAVPTPTVTPTIAGASPTPTSTPQTCVAPFDIFGNGSAGPYASNIVQNYPEVSRYSLVEPGGAIASMHFYVGAVTGRIQGVIYAADGPSGAPGTLLATTDAFTPAANQWNNRDLVYQLSAPAGDYWLGFQRETSGTVIYFSVGSDGDSYFSFSSSTFGSPPATYLTGTTDNLQWSVYASHCPFGPTATITPTFTATPTFITDPTYYEHFESGTLQSPSIFSDAGSSLAVTVTAAAAYNANFGMQVDVTTYGWGGGFNIHSQAGPLFSAWGATHLFMWIRSDQPGSYYLYLRENGEEGVSEDYENWQSPLINLVGDNAWHYVEVPYAAMVEDPYGNPTCSGACDQPGSGDNILNLYDISRWQILFTGGLSGATVHIDNIGVRPSAATMTPTPTPPVLTQTATPTPMSTATPTATPPPATPTPVATLAPSANPKPGETFAYPNPASGSVSFAWRMASSGSVDIKVFNAQAALVGQVTQSYSSGVQNYTLSLSGYSAGVYYYKITIAYGNGKTESLPLTAFVVSN